MKNEEVNKNHLLHNVCYLQHRVNNLTIEKRKMSFSHFKVKDQNIFRLALIDTGNLVHSAIGGKMSKSMDYKVGTADGHSARPLVIKGLSHSVNLGISFLMKIGQP